MTIFLLLSCSRLLISIYDLQSILIMKKFNRITASLLVQSLFMLVIVLGFFGLVDNDLVLILGVFLLFIQCLDAVDQYPTFRKVIKYFLLSVFFIVLGMAGLSVLSLLRDFEFFIGFIFGFLMITVTILVILSFVFIPAYFLGTLLYWIYLKDLTVKDKHKKEWTETEILDDNILNTLA